VGEGDVIITAEGRINLLSLFHVDRRENPLCSIMQQGFVWGGGTLEGGGGEMEKRKTRSKSSPREIEKTCDLNEWGHSTQVGRGTEISVKIDKKRRDKTLLTRMLGKRRPMLLLWTEKQLASLLGGDQKVGEGFQREKIRGGGNKRGGFSIKPSNRPRMLVAWGTSTSKKFVGKQRAVASGSGVEEVVLHRGQTEKLLGSKKRSLH